MRAIPRSPLRRAAVALATLAALVLPLALADLPGRGAAGAAVEAIPDAIPIGPNSLAPCPGAPIAPTHVVTGAFPEALTGSYVMLPFEVPAGTTQVRVKYCWEAGSTVDLGLWSARDGDAPWAEPQFRGWGGSSHPDVALSPQGFSTEEQYLAAPRAHVPGRTTRGFLPGPIPPGTWAAELGVAYVSPGGDAQADFRVEIELSDEPAFAAAPYEPAPYDATPANPSPGWYVGDLHVHAEHSALGDATMTEVFDYAFGPREEGKAGLDFVALTDYVTTSAWGEIGRHQAAHPGKLILRSSEIITYQGHANAHGALRYVDHRIGGPVYQLDPDTGVLSLLRAGRDPARAFAEIEAAGGVAQLNHVTTCPSISPDCRRICRGCPWDFRDEQTDYSRVQAIEVPSGSAVKFFLFGGEATRFWEQRLAAGHRIAVVGVSDSHQAGRTGGDPLAAPIGEAATVVHAEELSEAGILAGIRAGHTYAKLEAGGPDLRFSITGDQGGSGIMGDAIPDRSGTLRAEVLPLPPGGVPPYRLRLLRNGVVADEVAVPAEGIVREWRAEAPGIYRLELGDLRGVQTLSSSIRLPEPGLGAAAGTAAAGLLGLRCLAGVRRDRAPGDRNRQGGPGVRGDTGKRRPRKTRRPLQAVDA